MRNVGQQAGNFYFYSNTPTEWNDWAGPNPNDNAPAATSGVLAAYEPNPSHGGINVKATGKPWNYKLPWSRWPIDFGKPYTLHPTSGAPSGETENAQGVPRFKEEKVHINLHAIGKFKGKLAKSKAK